MPARGHEVEEPERDVSPPQVPMAVVVFPTVTGVASQYWYWPPQVMPPLLESQVMRVPHVTFMRVPHLPAQSACLSASVYVLQERTHWFDGPQAWSLEASH